MKFTWSLVLTPLLAAQQPQPQPPPQTEQEQQAEQEQLPRPDTGTKTGDEPSAGTKIGIPLLFDHNLAEWRDRILPDADETAWRRIGWHPTLRAGVLAAAAADKPLLLWAMNGHPLGCV